MYYYYYVLLLRVLLRGKELLYNILILIYTSIWFSSYLTDRTHYVSLCNHCSDFALVHSGFSSWPYAFHHVYYIHVYTCILHIHVYYIHGVCLPLLTHTLSYIINLLMTYNYRCLLPQIEYLSYFTLCSHV